MCNDALPNFDSLWNYNDPAATEQKFRALLQENPTLPLDWRLELQTQIARTQGLQQKFDAAHQILDAVEKELPQANARTKVRYLLERGRSFNSNKQQDKAIPLFKEAWDVARTAKEDSLAVDAAHMLGIACPPDEAIQWDEEAMRYAEASPDPKARKWLGPLYNNLGWTYHDKGEYQKALELFEKSLAFRIEQKQPAETRIARWSVGRAKRSLGQLEEALKIQQALLVELDGIGEKDGYVYEELGELNLALKHPTEAQKYFALAYGELSKDQWLTRDEPQRLERMKKLGDGQPDANPTPSDPKTK